MWYVMGEIALLLLLALLLGLLVGWLLWGRRIELPASAVQAPPTRRDLSRGPVNRTDPRKAELATKTKTAPVQTPPAKDRSVKDRSAKDLLSEDLHVEDPPADDTVVILSRTGGFVTPGQGRDGAPIDDLKAVDGITPEVEAVLHAQGISDFRQLGSLTDDQIDQLEQLLPKSQRRVRQDDWVGQARHLYNTKHRQSR